MSDETKVLRTREADTGSSGKGIANASLAEDVGLLVEGEEDFSMEEMENLYNKTLQNFTEGEVVHGTVVEVSADRVLMDIGYKSEGSIQIDEFPSPGNVSVGDQFDVYIEAPEDEHGMPVLSKMKADRIKNWTHIQRVYEEDGAIEGKIMRRVKGGLKVDIGIDAFMPASQLTWRPTGDLERYIGQTMQFKIIKLTKRRRNVVVSRRKLLEEQRAGEKNRLLATIQIGQMINGEVKNITDFGAFVDVGGIDGLLHVTDMSWGRVKHPSQAVSVGQRIDVMVLNFDPQTERISLGLKQKTQNPWRSSAQRYLVGGVTRGRVVSMTDYGAFIQLEEGIEGMVHVSEMSWTRRVRHPSEILTLDSEVDVMVLSVDPDAEKIALGIKQTTPNPWIEISQRYPVGSVLKGLVRNLTDYGAFIQIEEGIDGLLHVSDISWTKKVAHPSEVLEKGQEIDVKILSIDPQNEKISVGLKQLERDPWEAVIESTPIGSHVEVEIAKLVSFGAFARLENGIEGLIHVSEISADRVQKPEDVLTVGDTVKAKVIGIDPIERKIALSIREYQRDLDARAQAEYAQTKDHAVNVGDVVGDALPRSMLQAGRSLADAANELMATVSAQLASARVAQEQPSATPEPPAPEPPDSATEDKAGEEPPVSGGDI
jgi:small subunit ribosomal protein S1